MSRYRFREQRDCVYCASEFLATRRDMIYCSAACGRAVYRTTVAPLPLVARRVEPTAARQPKAPARRVGRDGYVTVGGVLEHRLIAEAVLRRRLTEKEIVHHDNGQKADNRPENLVVWDRAEHTRHHNTERRGFLLGDPIRPGLFLRKCNRTAIARGTALYNALARPLMAGAQVQSHQHVNSGGERAA